jgi:MFS family permease
MYKRRWIALLLLSLSLMLIIVDSTIVNIAFPSIRTTFHASFADAEWVNSIYSLVFGAALITWGKLGDQYGRRNIFIWGVIIFVLGSLGTGLAPSISVMILFRAAQGMGAAMMSPATLSIVSATFKGRERGIAFGLWGATAGVSAALGPILGGWLITNGTGLVAESWRLAFLINVPVGILTVAGSFWAIQESREKGISHRIDWLGILTASLALMSIVFGAIEGQNYGWLEARKVFTLGPVNYPALAAGVTTIPAGTVSFIPFVFAFGILMMLVFAWIEISQERQGKETLFEFGLLKYRSFAYGLLTVLIVALGEFGVVLVLSIFFQLAKGLSAFDTGLRFLPFALAVLVAAPTAGALSSRFGAKWVVTAGMLCEAGSLFWLSRVMYETTSYRYLIPPFLLYGAGVGLALAQLANLVLSDIPQDKVGLASGANNTVRQLGASLGIAIVGAVLFGAFASEAKPLIEQSTAFQDFATRVAANVNISQPSKLIGQRIASAGGLAKQSIEQGLDNNEGFDTPPNPVDALASSLPGFMKGQLKSQGADLDNPAVVSTAKKELGPDIGQLNGDIQNALGTGFSTAARESAIVAAVFVMLGALCSLLLPNTKHHTTEAVVAH